MPKRGTGGPIYLFAELDTKRKGGVADTSPHPPDKLKSYEAWLVSNQAPKS